ncbi:MAG: GNAT family N-acetyltransferase [Clostridia bacterium]|nr:GNAT family N-acetyltransferase [Clostridia bacterium]
MHIHIAALDDRNFWFSLDKHLNEALFTEKVRQKTGYILTLDDEPAGLLRYSLFWDTIPFCNLLYVKPDKQRKGCGRALMTFWEHEMKSKGCDLVMTSTQADEQAQHFYRRLGYADCGGFTLPFPEYQQPLELILAKKLS